MPTLALPGLVALVGSGEYTTAMEETDRYLLASRGGANGARVVCIPTASAPEGEAPHRWNAMGVAHFRGLGADVTPLPLLTRADATDPAIVSQLAGADLYYFSGGNPEYLTDTLRDTPAWAAILAAHQAGAALAGCSAGAMMLGGRLLRVRSAMNGQPVQWNQGLAVVPQLAIMPHFDRFAEFAGDERFRAIIASAPAGVTLVGIDEDTALVGHNAESWRVIGRQSVSVFTPAGAAVYHNGDSTELRIEN